MIGDRVSSQWSAQRRATYELGNRAWDRRLVGHLADWSSRWVCICRGSVVWWLIRFLTSRISWWGREWPIEHWFKSLELDNRVIDSMGWWWREQVDKRDKEWIGSDGSLIDGFGVRIWNRGPETVVRTPFKCKWNLKMLSRAVQTVLLVLRMSDSSQSAQWHQSHHAIISYDPTNWIFTEHVVRAISQSIPWNRTTFHWNKTSLGDILMRRCSSSGYSSWTVL